MSNQTLPGLTLPKGIKLPQQNPLAALLGGLGGGIGAGATEALKSKLLGESQQALALQKRLGKEEEPLTPYQKLSSNLRAKEQRRKTQNSVVAQLNTLSDQLKKGVILPADITSIASDITDKIDSGIDPVKALDEGIEKYRDQRLSLEELDIPKYKASKVEAFKKDVVDKFKARGITNRSIIGRALKKKNWKAKDINEVIKGVRKGDTQDKMPQPSQFAGKTIRDTDTGKLYRSDGTKWTEVK